MWLSLFPNAPPSGKRGSAHSLFAVALEEACSGAGVLMAHEALVAARLKSGTLVAPFDQKLSLGRSLMMRIAPGFRDKPTCTMLLHAVKDDLMKA